MFNVCARCGEYSGEKFIEPEGPFAVCPFCGYRQQFVRLPMFVVSGPSGTGKTTVYLDLAHKMTECVCVETDILWRAEFCHAGGRLPLVSRDVAACGTDHQPERQTGRAVRLGRA